MSKDALTVITIYMLEDDPPVITSSDTSFAVEDETYNYLYNGYDPDIGINWQVALPKLSEKDAVAPLFKEFKKALLL